MSAQGVTPGASGGRRGRYALPAGLAVAGLAAMILATGGDAWPLALAWAAVAVAFGWVWRWLPRRRARIIMGLVSAAALVALTWEGGLFLLPAAVAAVLIADMRRG